MLRFLKKCHNLKTLALGIVRRGPQSTQMLAPRLGSGAGPRSDTHCHLQSGKMLLEPLGADLLPAPSARLPSIPVGFAPAS